MASTKLFTFQDAMEHLFLVMNPATKPPTGRELRVAKAAVINAYRELPNVHRWSYYRRRQLIKTDASYSTGTVVYDHTGGSSERLVTLTGGTFPANAAYGTIKISDACYPVETRVGDTTLTLGANNNPGSDVTTATTYEWFRDTYPLPVNFRRLGATVLCSSAYTELAYVDQNEFLLRSRVYADTDSEADWYTVLNDGKYIGSLSIAFCPAPSTAKAYECVYDISPRELATYLYYTGTVSCVAGSTTVSGSSTVFSSAHVGSVIRFPPSGTTLPTGVIGTSDGTTNPYWAQRIITAVASTISLTIDASLSDTAGLSGVGYVISDPVDLEVDAMLPYFLRCVEAEYAMLSKRDDAEKMRGRALFALPFAIASDVRSSAIAGGQLNDGGWNGSAWGDVDGVPS